MHRIVFFGTSDFAVPHLEALVQDSRFHVVAVVTQPDKPVGRHAELTPPPVKRAAERYTLPTFQPEKLSELNSILPPDLDVGVVVSYGKILPPWLLELPARGFVNVHASLLPRWRGPSPIHAAIAAGDTHTGVTVMKLDEAMDHGPILATDGTSILDTDTGGSLHDRLAGMGATLLPNILDGYLSGKTGPTTQDHTKATYCKILTRENGKIDWFKTAHEIERQVRAYDPWPGSWTELSGKRLKILAVKIRPNNASFSPGQRFVWKKRPTVGCGQGTTVELVTVQPEGKKPMSGEEFIRGNKTWSE
ncbi:methionyl-tRNA formyltransferase [Candidatus Uhrbacteria bacterium]|nr:methionyl-tRNA formyltransferase [Candidatus Uhrbacteria bacterium]